jgi:hypothetical protein
MNVVYSHVFRRLTTSRLMALTVGGLEGSLQGADPSTVLVTGTGPVLLTTQQVLQIPAAVLSPRLQFDFGFATDEIQTPGTFADSFSITLQNGGTSSTALLLTADVTGVQWTPPNPGGLSLKPGDVTPHAIPFPAGLATNLDLRSAYSVSFDLPPELSGRPVTLFLDLFDNTNRVDSLAFLDHLTLFTGLTTNSRPAFALQSSAAVQGPFADEGDVEMDASTRTLTLSENGPARFFHIKSESQVVITRFRLLGNEAIMDYEFPSPQVLPQAAVRLEGPYYDDPTARIHLGHRSLTVAKPGTAQFYRLRSNIRTQITRTQLAGDQLTLFYEYHPMIFGVQSSADVRGPYADESGAAIDLALQTITLSRLNSARFFRVRGNTPYLITKIQVAGGQVRITYK